MESLVLGEWLGVEGIEGVVETSVILAVVSDWIDGDSINSNRDNARSLYSFCKYSIYIQVFKENLHVSLPVYFLFNE